MNLEKRLQRLEEKVSQKKRVTESVSPWLFKKEFTDLINKYLGQAERNYGIDTEDYNSFELQMRQIVVSTFNANIQGFEGDLSIR